MILAAAMAACGRNAVPIDVRVVRPACSDDDPMEGVTHVRVRVTGDDMSTMASVAEVGRGRIEVPDIPAGTNRQIEVVGLAGAPPGGSMVSVGRSAPFSISDRKDPNAVGISATVLLRRVDAFTRVCKAAAPGEVARLTEPRAGHAATLLADGRVLFTGGFTAAGIDETARTMTPGAEIFDPSAGDFRRVSPMAIAGAATPRALHGAVRLPSGQVYVAGGEQVTGGQMKVVASGIRYDPGTDTWQQSEGMHAPSPGSGRSRHCSVLDGESAGRPAIVSLGGVSTAGLNGAVEWYDVQADRSFMSPPSTNPARVGHQCVPLVVAQASYVAVIGGRDEEPCPTSMKCLNGVQCTAGSQCTGAYLCPPFGRCVDKTACAEGTSCTDSYSCTTRCQTDGSACSAAVACPDLASTVAFVSYRANDNPPAYKPVPSGADISITPLRSGLACSRIFSDTRFLCCGGEDARGAKLTDCMTVRVESPTATRKVPQLSEARADACAVTLPDGRAMVIGGRVASSGGDSSSDKVDLFLSDKDLTTVSSSGGTLADARYSHTCTMLQDGSVLVAGGLKRNGSSVVTLDTAEIVMPRPID